MLKINETVKRFITILLVVTLVFSVTACGDSKINNKSSESNVFSLPGIESDEEKNDEEVSDEAENINYYIDTEIFESYETYNKPSEFIPISINEADIESLEKFISENETGFRYAEYYGLDEALNKYENTQYNKELKTDLLDENGKINAEKLIEKVKENNIELRNDKVNSINAFYQDMDEKDMVYFCNLIADVSNDLLEGDDLKELADTLMNLTMFNRVGSASMAYISDDITFVYSPTMTQNYATMQDIQGNKSENHIEAIITHEIMHLMQYASNDNIKENGNEAGFARKYNDEFNKDIVPVDSLWYSWILEASAEVTKSYYLNIEHTMYSKMISYSRSFNLSRLSYIDTAENKLESIIFTPTLQEAFKKLGLENEYEQRRFLEFMYSVEITQTDPEEFWLNYTAKTNKTPTDEEKTAIRMEIRSDIIKMLTVNYYKNIVNELKSGKITDLNTLFYLIYLWELDSYGHLEYTKEGSFESAEDSLLLQESLQEKVFEALANSLSYDTSEIMEMYENYEFTYISDEDEKVNNCDLTKFTKHQAYYLASAKDYIAASNFVKCSEILNNK